MIRHSTRLVLMAAAVAVSALGQSASPSTIVGAGYQYPAPLGVAPGQVITIFTAGGGNLTQAVFSGAGKLPTSLAGISASLAQQTLVPAPILQVAPVACGAYCGVMTAVTIQIPYELQLPPANGLSGGIALLMTENGVAGNQKALIAMPDQVHMLTVYDIAIGGSGEARCPWEVTHANGLLVSSADPAAAGEELVAYAVGLGATNPTVPTGQPATQSTPTAETFRLSFNFQANALPSAPPFTPGNFTAPLYTGLTPNYSGLYQINFVVPNAPVGLQPCGELASANLTVNLGGQTSFDGAAICVSVSR